MSLLGVAPRTTAPARSAGRSGVSPQGVGAPGTSPIQQYTDDYGYSQARYGPRPVVVIVTASHPGRTPACWDGPRERPTSSQDGFDPPTSHSTRNGERPGARQPELRAPATPVWPHRATLAAKCTLFWPTRVTMTSLCARPPTPPVTRENSLDLTTITHLIPTRITTKLQRKHAKYNLNGRGGTATTTVPTPTRTVKDPNEIKEHENEQKQEREQRTPK